MASKTAERFMQVLQAAEQTRELKSLVEMFTEEAELINLARTEPLRGQDGAGRFWQDYLSVFDHIHSKFTNVVEAEGTIVLEWISQGALSNGEPLNYRGISVLETNNGQVYRFRTYYDSAVFLSQGASR